MFPFVLHMAPRLTDKIVPKLHTTQFWGGRVGIILLTCIHDAITSGKNPSGKRIIPNSDRATNALEAVRLFPVKTYTVNVLTAT